MEAPIEKPEIIYEGVAASPGVAHGWAFIYVKQELDIPTYNVDDSGHDSEVARFEQALIETRGQINEIRSEVASKLGEDEARIFDAHLLVLEDVALIDETIRSQRESKLNIETCFHEVSQRYIEAFRMMDDDYIKERLADIQDVARRVLNVLLGQTPANISHLSENRIIIAEDLPPSLTATIDKSKVLGFLTDTGSRTSHAVIMARSLQVPAVVGLHDLSLKVSQEDYVLVDGYEGKAILNPSQNTLFTYGQYQRERQNLQIVFESALDAPSQTEDGHGVKLMANIGGGHDIAQAHNMRAEGVGLFRTESLFLGRSDYPSEEEQFEAYRSVVESMNGKDVVIRTLDIGGDKQLSHQHYTHKEENPFMGLRAVRFCLEHQDVFREQLSAILRASAFGKVKIMYPMISGLEELEQSNALLDEVRQDLRAREVAFDEELEIGIMIEVPSAVMIADLLAEHCDFFSVGTNDLIQYTLAVDRVNDRIAHLYQPSHPAVIRSLKVIADAAKKQGIEVGVCGEMASDPIFLPLLVGLGIDDLSLTPVAIPEVKYLLTRTRYEDTRKMLEEMLEEKDPQVILKMLKEYYASKMQGISQ